MRHMWFGAWQTYALGAATGAFGAYINGARGSSLVRAAISGAVGAGLAPGGGSFNAWRAIGADIVGGVASLIGGGKLGHGFVAADIGNSLGGYLKDVSRIARIGASAVIGGIVSELTGGKFANGAITGAFAAAIREGVQTAQDKPQTVSFEVLRDGDGNISGLVVYGTTVNVASGTQHNPNLDSGSTEVFIGYTEVMAYQHHAFVLAVDPANGTAYITRAGPHLCGAGDFASALSQSSAGGSLAGSSGNAGSGGVGFNRIDTMTDIYTAGIRHDNPANVVAFQRVETLNQKPWSIC